MGLVLKAFEVARLMNSDAYIWKSPCPLSARYESGLLS
jgi:hypothetical protein